MHPLAILQLAYDLAGTPSNMNGGDSDTNLLLPRRANDSYEELKERHP